ncbi:MAG TPA: hypothetical protein VGP64_05945 [Polyangia bacterium]
MTRWQLVLAIPIALAAAGARAQSLVDEVPEDPCEAARGLAIDDASPSAENLRRACRLEHFENRLTTERHQQVAVEEQRREDRVQAWLADTQPARVTHPLAVEGFVGTGLASYGLVFAWDFLKRAEVNAWVGWRPISCQDQYTGTTSACGRTAFGLKGRWYLTDYNVTPFLDGGISLMSSHLQLYTSSTSSGGSNFASGSGSANSLDAGAGLELGYRAFRVSFEYVFEYTFYTYAATDDAKKMPNMDLENALADSLRADRNGLRFQVGYAF